MQDRYGDKEGRQGEEDMIECSSTLAMLPDDRQSYAARERIASLQARLMEVTRTIRDYYNREYTTVMKEGFDERLTAYFNEDVRRWAVKLRDLGYMLRRSTMSCPRPYVAGSVPVQTFKHTARQLAVEELQLVRVSARNTGRGWWKEEGNSRSEGRRRGRNDV